MLDIDKSMPITTLRGLLVRQKGKCAISGVPLTTANMIGDHIEPLKKMKEQGNTQYDNKENVWLVHKAFNRIKSTSSYDQLIENCKMILAHEKEARKMIREIRKGGIKEVGLDEFKDLTEKHYDSKTDTLEFK